MAVVRYSGDSVTPEWLRVLDKQPGNVWIELEKGNLVIVHEFEDQKGVLHASFSENQHDGHDHDNQ